MALIAKTGYKVTLYDTAEQQKRKSVAPFAVRPYGLSSDLYWGNLSWPFGEFDLTTNSWMDPTLFNIEQLGGGRYRDNLIVVSLAGKIFYS